jgi:hypothetical protein
MKHHSILLLIALLLAGMSACDKNDASGNANTANTTANNYNGNLSSNSSLGNKNIVSPGDRTRPNNNVSTGHTNKNSPSNIMSSSSLHPNNANVYSNRNSNVMSTSEFNANRPSRP